MSSKIQIIPHNRQGQLNTAFLATVPGVLKIAEIVCIFPFLNRIGLYVYKSSSKDVQCELEGSTETFCTMP